MYPSPSEPSCPLSIAAAPLQVLACSAGPQRALPEAQSATWKPCEILPVRALPGPAALQGPPARHAEHAEPSQGPLSAEHAAQ